MKTPAQTHRAITTALPQRAIATAGAILLLTAFAPPEDTQPEDRPPPPEPAQQVIPQDKIPKSWIPEFPKKAEDSLVFRSTPQVDSAIEGDTQLGPDCPFPISKRWDQSTAEADAASALVKAGKYGEALDAANRLARRAETAADRYLVLTIIGSIYEKSGNKPGQAEALRALVAGNCFLVPGEKAFLQKKIDALGQPAK
jgi:hypothetical protein